MPTWNPIDYQKFVDHRLRPTLDLLAQIPLDKPSTVYDLGCGPGHVTRLLAQRWPAAAVTGIDSSAEMLTTAREGTPDVTFLQADIAQWSPPEPADLCSPVQLCIGSTIIGSCCRVSCHTWRRAVCSPCR